jgi:hypothetical protein
MAGLVPAIHVFHRSKGKTWMPLDKPGMTTSVSYRDTCAETASHLPFCRAQQSV